jgi:hypothetical protein
MFARVFSQALLICLAAGALGQGQPQPIAQQSRLMAYVTFFVRVSWIADRAATLVAQAKNPTSIRSSIGRDFDLTDAEQALVIAIGSDWGARIEANQAKAEVLHAAGQSISSSPELQGLLAARLDMTWDHISQLQAALGPARFAALDALVTQPRTRSAPPDASSTQRARLTAYNAFFGRFWLLEDRAAFLDRYEGPVGSWTRTAAAREFGMTVSEQALVSPIVADWRARNSAIDDQARKVYDGGRVTRSPELQTLEENRLTVLSNHVDQLQVALGAARFEALDALVRRNYFPRPQNHPELTVHDVYGQSTPISSAGMTYEGRRRPGVSHTVALIVYTREGIEQFDWETISRVEIDEGRATITLKTGETFSGAELPSRAALDGQSDSSGRTVIDFSKIKTLTVSP